MDRKTGSGSDEDRTLNEELLAMDQDTVEDAFYRDIAFGLMLSNTYWKETHQ